MSQKLQTTKPLLCCPLLNEIGLLQLVAAAAAELVGGQVLGSTFRALLVHARLSALVRLPVIAVRTKAVAIGAAFERATPSSFTFPEASSRLSPFGFSEHFSLPFGMQ